MKATDSRYVSAVIVAAGRGTRAGGGTPKQWRDVAGKPVAIWTIETFANHPEIEEVVVVIHPDDHFAKDMISAIASCRFVTGADSRDGSVKAGLSGCSDATTDVLIHDVARPCVAPSLISELIEALTVNHAAAPGIAVTDALWTGTEGTVSGTVDRTALFRAQTPQAFKFAEISQAHAAYEGAAADDVEVARAAGIDVAIVPGHENNIKITTPEDFARVQAILGQRQKDDLMDVRVGNGFDVHRFEDGDHVILCGIEIPHDRKLKGHSDADVGLHAITDAIYGALSQGDIGTHFPPSDPQWKGAASHIFLEHARDMVVDMGFTLTHVDCTLICEHPKIGPHALSMRAKVSEILNIDIERVSVKATTSERLGFTGRGEGIACMTTATLVKS